MITCTLWMFYFIQGVSVLMGPLLRRVPLAVLFGVFLYMGIASMSGIQLFERTALLFTPTKHHPNTGFVRRVSSPQTHIFYPMLDYCWGSIVNCGLFSHYVDDLCLLVAFCILSASDFLCCLQNTIAILWKRQVFDFATMIYYMYVVNKWSCFNLILNSKLQL